MTAAEFWGTTLAQLAALIPSTSPAPAAAEGTSGDLLALAEMQGRVTCG